MNIVIVGGGFGGVKAALEISKRKLGHVTLVSEEPYFLNHATLYSTATGNSKAESVILLDDIFAGNPNVKVVKDKMLSIDQERKLVVGKAKSYEYDQLIIAIGSVTTFFGIDGMAQHAFGIKSLQEVDKFSSHLREEIIENGHLDKNYYIVGAGQTGTELAGALVEYLKYLVKTHKNTKGRIRVNLVEAEDRILPRMSRTASRFAQKRLKAIGVNVITSHKVNAVDEDFITIEGKKIPTETVVWTSGVANNPFFNEHNHLFQLNAEGRVIVDKYLRASRGIYVIGDNNSVKYSGMAWPAIREATFLAKHMSRLRRKKALRAFRPLQPPSGVPIGYGWGYVEWHGLYVKGTAGYLVRRYLELLGYCNFLTLRKAISVWTGHYLKEIHTTT